MNTYKHSIRLTATFSLLITLLLTACGQQKQPTAPLPHFTINVRLPATPVKNQGQTSFCWIYAMLATIETEHIARGDSVNLSTDYVARAFLREQALEGYAADGAVGITQRGVASMTLRLLQTYGLTHYDAFHRSEEADIDALVKQLGVARGRATSLTDYALRADQLLNRTFGEAMPKVFFLGAQYTPLEFAHSVCTDDEYEAVTSFTHHPFGSRFPLEVHDNHYHDTFLNVPIDTLYNMVARSVLHGHPVCWEGDTSEPGFSFAQGVAELPPSATVSQEERQAQFDDRRTTDDHCMAIIGLAHDEQGRRYFLLKNSWGTHSRFHGYMFMSEPYFRMKTIAIIRHK